MTQEEEMSLNGAGSLFAYRGSLRGLLDKFIQEILVVRDMNRESHTSSVNDEPFTDIGTRACFHGINNSLVGIGIGFEFIMLSAFRGS